MGILRLRSHDAVSVRTCSELSTDEISSFKEASARTRFSGSSDEDRKYARADQSPVKLVNSATLCAAGTHQDSARCPSVGRRRTCRVNSGAAMEYS